MNLTTILNLMAGAMHAGYLSSGFAQSAVKTATAKPLLALASVASTKTGSASLPTNHLLISTPSGLLGAAASDSKTIKLASPAATQVDTLKAFVNGNDVSSRFTATDCATSGCVCAIGPLSEGDGVRAGENVLSATVKKGLLILPTSLSLPWRIRKGAHGIQPLVCLVLLALAFTGFLSGRNGRGSKIQSALLAFGRANHRGERGNRLRHQDHPA